MAMMKAGLAGAAIGALALATVIFIAPIAAQGPGGPPYGPDGFHGPGGPGGPGGPRGPGMMGRGGDVTGPMGRGGETGRRAPDPNDPDITGPRGELANCQERLTRIAQARLERIALLVRPTDEQRPAFEELRMASVKAVELLRAACPAEQPLTPTARMAAAEKWLEARLAAVKLVRPALESFWRLLSDEQKVRWSTGPSAGHRFGDDFRGRWQDRRGPGWDRRGEERWRGDDAWRDGRGGSGDDRGSRPDERWGQRWRDDGGWERRWREQDRWRERRRGGEPDEERL